MEIKVCIGSACHLRGSYNLINMLQQCLEKSGKTDQVDLRGVFCLGKCSETVSVMVDDTYFGVAANDAKAFFDAEIAPKLK